MEIDETRGEPLNPEYPPPLPDARRGPWGPWATIGWAIVLFVAVTAVGIVIGVGFIATRMIFGGMKGVNPAEIDDTLNSGLFLSVAQFPSVIVVLGLTLLLIQRRRGPSVREYLALNVWPIRKQWIKWTLVTGAYYVVLEGVNLALDREVPEFMVETYRTAGFVPLLWLAVILGAPLMEEPVVRGFMFFGLQRSALGNVGAILITALGWAVIHLQYSPYEMAGILGLGIILGASRASTQSLWVPLFLHIVWNFTSTVQLAIHLSQAK